MRIVFVVCFFLLAGIVNAQHSSPPASNLSRNISLNIKDQPLSMVLNKMSSAGNFYFSYSGDVIKSDPVVSIYAQNTSVKNALSELLDDEVEYKESGKYIILRSVSQRFRVVPEVVGNTGDAYEIQGYVYDESTGAKVKNASVYERTLLKTTLTNQDGYFNLHLKGEQKSIALTFSKENFRDTTIQFLQSVEINANNNNAGNEGILNRIERLGLSRFLTTSRQRIQSLNIGSVVANAPFQASLLPGLSTHGMLSSQVVNKGSLNLFGGYTAGVDGVEVAGFFNINKKDVKKFQAAGLLNLVGGSVTGFQAAGLFNVVLDSVKGFQAAGLFNYANDKVYGVQAAGLSNIARHRVQGTQFAGLTNTNWQDFEGVQAAALINFSRKSSKGSQIAGLANFTGSQLKGIQIGGLINYARRMNGTQIGLINVADTSSGYSIGLLNLVRKGYHKVSLSANEVMNVNLSLKTGNSKLYTMLIGGANFSNNEKAYATGLGLGHDFIFTKNFSIAAEFSNQFLHLGRRNELNVLSKVQANLQYQLINGFTVFAGPSFAAYYSDAPTNPANGYRSRIGPVNRTNIAKNTSGWPGFAVGITLM
jgi:hypothetical protein